MNYDAYRKLAQKLDAIPNGFPQTESGIELKLLAKICTSEEAALAATNFLLLIFFSSVFFSAKNTHRL